jgi:hypothetical protein
MSMKTVKDPVADARKALEHYLSDVFGVNFYFPDSLGERFDEREEENAKESTTFGYFITQLPTVRQKSINGKFSDFYLPLVSKQINLAPHVVAVINTMLFDESLDDFEVPTFFYPDGTTMVIAFSPRNISWAISILALHPEYLDCLCPVKKGGT